jgi:hypothetical protein
MSNEFEWQFHFRNFHDFDFHVRVHHAGCAKTKWHDGRPCCWEKDIPYCPQGLSSGEAVYRPSEWVTHFGDFWQLIKDGLILIKDVGLTIFKKPTTREDIVDVVSDVFAVASDIVSLCIDEMTDEEIEEMLQKAYDSVEHVCQVNGMDYEIVQQMAKDMNLDPNAWGIIGGSAYREYIWSKKSPIDAKWSVFCGWEDKHEYLNIAEACFVEKGHLIYPCYRSTGEHDPHPIYGETIKKFWSGNFDN